MEYLIKIVIFSVALVHLCSAVGYDGGNEEDCPTHGYFNGDKIFMSVELTGITWEGSLVDHESDGFKEIARRIAKQMKIYASSRPDTVCAKLIELSETADILAKIVVKIGESDKTDSITSEIIENIRKDIDATGILGNDIEVKPGSLIVYTVEKGKKSSYADGATNYPQPQDPNKYLRPGEKLKCKGTSLRRYMTLTNPTWNPDYLDTTSVAYKALVEQINEQFKLVLGNIENFAGITVFAVKKSGTDNVLVKYGVNVLTTGKECTQDIIAIYALLFEELSKVEATGNIGDLVIVPDESGALYVVFGDFFIIKDYNPKFKDACKTVVYKPGSG